jgi:hypothetical protein
MIVGCDGWLSNGKGQKRAEKGRNLMAKQNFSHTQEEMVGTLRKYGVNHSFAALGTGVVIVGPGAPFSVSSTWFAAADLEEAAEAGILERRKLTELGLDTFAVK